ncbi:protein NRT1/ PTR FAMILY 8.3-like isoform X4 [Macadamia integrifolia]|uniref:protein NRT1/ PTR FAMILY 8.3-like isoform X4 n=1 Tax=Macadamia integrifolia TaxID=60698 RepID=UPI001C4E820B|nr:protein NRT1/ PTR FAMILY 8.3-like isoform X4 [Macadamia integrifolia]
MGSMEEERLLLEDGLIENGSRGPYTGDGSVDINGKPVLKQNTGNWRACPFILGTEGCERLASCGIAANLVTYLTSKLHEGNVSAARTVTTWSGTCSLAPLIGAVLADSYWGRYWTIAVFCIIYFIGMGTLTLSASVPAFRPPPCSGSVCTDTTPAQYAVFFCSLYLIALGTGGIKPCVSSFGADQFDDTDPRERVKKGSFFNWFYLSINIGALISSSFIVWIQDNAGWGLGFGIPTLFMGLSVIIFFSGTPLYRFQKPGGSPLTRMCQVVVASIRKWNLEVPEDSFLLYELPEETSAIEGSRKLEHSDELRCLDKAAVVSDLDVKQEEFSNSWRLCTVTQVEELKILIRMIPIWATGIVFSAVYAQMFTMFVEQGMAMDTTIGSFTIPPASLLTFDIISVIVWVPMYDRIIVPIARKFTGKERGFSELQRMGIGLFISILAMSAAAILEIKRLEIAKSLDLVDQKVAVPMSILWQVCTRTDFDHSGSPELLNY